MATLRVRKQLSRCRACGRQSRENPPHAYPQARRQEILHAYQERSSLRVCWLLGLSVLKRAS